MMILMDMEYVYKELDKGRTVGSLAEELGVHRDTIYEYHKRFQQENTNAGACWRSYLSPRKGSEKSIDMNYVIDQIKRENRTIKSIAMELSVTPRTLNRHFKKFAIHNGWLKPDE